MLVQLMLWTVGWHRYLSDFDFRHGSKETYCAVASPEFQRRMLACDLYANCNAAVQKSRSCSGRAGAMFCVETRRRVAQLQRLAPGVDRNFECGKRAMSSLTEMNEALRRQTFHGRWTPAPAASVNRPRAGLVETLVRAMKRRHTANLLRQLDSRLLDDIGITRGEIDQIAAKAATEAVVREGAPAMPRIAWLTKLLASILTGLTNAWQRQSTIVALQRLSNHTLADIGIDRGHIVETVDAMMAHGETTAAPARATVTAKVATANAPKTAPKPVEIVAPAHKVAA